jgi:16S rRNA (guanine527-N7)-methyltransferase
MGGSFIAQKGPDIEDEISSAISAIDVLGGSLIDKVKVPSGYLVVIKKILQTPKEYPRRAGIPAKRPL